jgi:tetratricopeptide (TPR) repeat protein
VRLFVERAKRVQPDFTLTAENAAVIVEICQRLDGLPLGIELAAARIPLLGASGIRDRLARQLDLGGTVARDAPARQQTLESTIGWSHDLLDAAGQMLFARLAIFANGWRIEQAEEVCGPGTELEGRVADVAAGLAEQSLVTTTLRGDGVRFGMLETVRQDATRRLNLDASRGELKQRHALAYLALAEEHGPALETRDAAIAVVRLEEERGNVRSALQWAIATGNAEVGLRLGAALYRFWALIGDIQEGSATLAAILALPGAETPTLWRMRALEAAGNLSYYSGDSVRPRQMYVAQLELARALNDRKGIADARYNLAFTDYSPVEWQPALAELDALVAEYEALGEDRAKWRVYWARATRLTQGGRHVEAVAILEEALPQYRALGDPYLTQAAGLLSALSFKLGDPVNAVRWLVEALSAATQAGNLPSITGGLPSMAMAAFHLGQPAAAATILGAYESLSRRYGVRMPENLRESQDALDPVDQVAAAISAEAYEEAYTRGTLMSIDEVVDFVRDQAGGGAG